MIMLNTNTKLCSQYQPKDTTTVSSFTVLKTPYTVNKGIYR